MRAFSFRGKRGLAALALGGLTLAGAVVVIAGGGSDGETTADAAASSTSTATTTVKRQDLVEIETEDGTLGYANARGVTNGLPGTVTWLPAIGSVVRSDRALYKVDDSPVILMDGSVPAYRPLGPGVSAGTDVRQLEESLRAAGYDPDREIEIDTSWDGGTTAAVLRWQEAHGFSETGDIELGRVVFLPCPRRISSTDAALGASNPGAGPPGSLAEGGSESPPGPVPGASSGAAGNAALTTTSTRRLVTVDLDTTKSTLAKKGERVRVVLPSGRRVGGRISSVGKVATLVPSSSESSSGSSADTTATIEVKIRLFSAKTGLDQAPVTVRFEQSRRKDVLAIPVTALLAQPGGRFAVQLVETDGGRRTVAVAPGLYTSGFVEIAGTGLKPGQRVTNAAL